MYHVRTSTVVNAPIEKVWATVRDFDALPKWHPVIATSEIEDGRPSDQIGCVRHFTLQDGAEIREQLRALDDFRHICTYCILASPMPLANYVATLRFESITDGERTFAEWTAKFECEEGDAAGLIDLVGKDVFLAGLNALNQKIGV